MERIEVFVFMIQERFFSFFLSCSLLIHIVLLGYLILDPLSGIFAKKNIRLTQAVRINSIDFSDLPSPKKFKDNALPLKTSLSKSTPEELEKSQKAKPAPKTLTVPKKKQTKKKSKKLAKKPKKSQKPDSKNQMEHSKTQALKNIQQKQKHAMDKLSALESIEKIKQELSEPNPQNPLHTGGGQVSDGQKTDFQTLQYFAKLKAHINMYWSLPQELAGKNWRTQVYAEIDRTGRVLQGKILKSSGNEDFDARVLETINRASPFPPPPTKKIEKLLSNGIVFNFPK